MTLLFRIQDNDGLMQDLNDLYYFVHIVDNGGFAAASRALGEPKSKLSRRLAQLEERLGVQLVQRSTRHFSVTDIGKTYYAHCKAMLVEADAAQEVIELTRAEPCGTVRMSCPIALLEATVGAMLADFMLQYPLVDVHLQATNRRVDLLDENIDIALRVRPMPLQDSDLVVRVLGDREQCLAASPALLAEHEAAKVPADLGRYPSLGLGQPHHKFEWRLHGKDDAEATIRHTPRLVTDDMVALRTAAVAGVGIVQLPRLMIADELQDGRLQVLLPDWAPQNETIHAAFVSRRGLLPAVRALIDFLADAFERLDGDQADIAVSAA